MRRCLALVLALLLTACASVPAPAPAELFDDALFEPPSHPVDAREVFRLSDAMRRYLDEDLARRDPSVILAGPVEVARLSGDARWRGLRAVREGRVLAYDTALVSRPSLRLGEAARALARLLHPAARVP